MLTRGKKLVNLALNEKSTTTTSIQEEETLGEYDSFEVTVDDPSLVNDDPWLDYNKWRQARQQKPRCVAPDEVQNELQNCTQDFGKSVFHELQSLQMSPKPLHTSDYNLPENMEMNGEASERDMSNSIKHFEKPGFHELRPLEMSPGPLHASDNNVMENVETGDDGSVIVDSVNSDSSYSWKPDSDHDEASLVDSYSETSEVIRKISPISYKASQDLTPTPINQKPVEHSLRKGRVWDKRDRCAYCNKDITNFSRHLFRNHANEESVKKILEQPKGDRKRKFMVDLLRKQGNFSILGENIIRPVQRPTSKQNEDDVAPTDYFPCKYCKGLYKRKSLRRHALNCYFNNENKQKRNFASEGQTMMAFTESRQEFLKKLRLKSEVFDKMHADRISFNGKSDPIICQYAEDYLRKHKRPHIKNAVSNKVRELGRLLIPLQDNYKINSMIEMLKPEHFDKVASASRIISGYNDATRSFRAPSLALHLKTILLAVCSSAKTLLLKKDPVLAITDYKAALKDIKGFRELVDANWKFEMGSLALKNLNENQSSNPQKLPVTQDIILFRNYTNKVAETCMQNLKANPEDMQSFKSLTESAMALTIILNRKRIGDVQYTKLESYNRNSITNNQEECLNVLSESEKVLAKHFKRITAVGKGSKSIPILFSKRVQEYIETLLSVRKITTFIPQENPFLFALTGSSSKWVDGSAVLRKYAVKCGAENPGTLTSSRLRKQIATVLQILNLNDTEMEQMATFMGHTKKTHEQFYRLPQEVFQTAKIAKLLLMMERGVGSENQGKTLAEIDVELESWNRQTFNENGNESEAEDSDEPNEPIEPNTPSQPDIPNVLDDPNMTVSNIPQVPEYEDQNFINSESEEEAQRKIKKQDKLEAKKRNCRGTWSERQKSALLKFFKSHIRTQTAPKKAECLKCREDHLDLFKEKNWVQIKVFVYNTYKNQNL